MIQTLKLEYSILILDIWIFHQYPEISIDELTQVFFDYDAGQILKEHEYLKDIVPAGPIYISEEV